MEDPMYMKCLKHVVVVRQGDTISGGVIVRHDMVATSCDIVDGKGEIQVMMGTAWLRVANGQLYPATVYDDDSHKDRDVCLLNVGELPGVPVEKRDFQTLNINEEVFAISFCHDKNSSSISAVPDLFHRDGVIAVKRKKENISYVQMDSPIGDKVFGGGIFDMDGKLVGLLNRKIASEDKKHLAFAMPLDWVMDS